MGRTTVRRHIRKKPKGGTTTVRKHYRRTSGKNKAPYIPRNVKIIHQKPPTMFSRKKAIDEINNSIVKGLFEGAIVHGLSAAYPPLGAILLPSYDYLKLSLALYRASRQIKKSSRVDRMKVVKRVTPKVVDESTSLITSGISYHVASNIVDSSFNLLGSGDKVFSDILKGTISNGFSEGAGGLASYTVGTVLGV